jgi:hypothetical protein
MNPEFPLTILLSLSCPAAYTTTTLTVPAVQASRPLLPSDKDVPEPVHPEEGTTFVSVGASGAPMANTRADVMTSTPSQLLIGFQPRPAYDFFPTPAVRNLKLPWSRRHAGHSCPALVGLAKTFLGVQDSPM